MWLCTFLSEPRASVTTLQNPLNDQKFMENAQIICYSNRLVSEKGSNDKKVHEGLEKTRLYKMSSNYSSGDETKVRNSGYSSE
ncbi:hypothetical protein TNIN_377051 [Trichonephila inaurata madagascariensis]|uniref:Uncharacterized protein n=1 Tax=Trichonephila inaurata madagascariensis TaxID=2747483 RepID=A0A8X6XCM3_9ARAC|nr:hypothetical protein TNIN_455241 [Trichonephila inaurata madagascariensis]GFY50451.1 hypothetical protein TNIN_377051 [Trichonephila inaurata madagascariensis]